MRKILFSVFIAVFIALPYVWAQDPVEAADDETDTVITEEATGDEEICEVTLAMERAEKARTAANEFESDFPEEWEAAEALFNGAAQFIELADQAIEAYNLAADAYDAIIAQATAGDGESDADVNELYAAMKRMEESRTMVIDFEGSSYFPGEWENAEILFTEAGQLPADNAENIKKAEEAFNHAADAYDAIFALTLPLYAQAREDEIMSIRGDLIAAGVRDSFPQYFTPADKEAVLALEQYEADDYYASRETAARAFQMYRTLELTFNIWQVRQIILDMGFEQRDLRNFEEADSIISDAMDAYVEKNTSVAQEKAIEALQKYSIVLTAGLASEAGQRAISARAARQTALNNKVNIATPEIFAAADAVLAEAAGLFESHHYVDAINAFINAEALYAEGGTETAVKRHHAEEAMKEALAKIFQSRIIAGLEEPLVCPTCGHIINGGSK